MADDLIYFGDPLIWFDGKVIPSKDARIHVLTHGLHYGSCVFEGERAHRAAAPLRRHPRLHDPLYGRPARNGQGRDPFPQRKR